MRRRQRELAELGDPLVLPLEPRRERVLDEACRLGGIARARAKGRRRLGGAPKPGGQREPVQRVHEARLEVAAVLERGAREGVSAIREQARAQRADEAARQGRAAFEPRERAVRDEGGLEGSALLAVALLARRHRLAGPQLRLPALPRGRERRERFVDRRLRVLERCTGARLRQARRGEPEVEAAAVGRRGPLPRGEWSVEGKLLRFAGLAEPRGDGGGTGRARRLRVHDGNPLRARLRGPWRCWERRARTRGEEHPAPNPAPQSRSRAPRSRRHPGEFYGATRILARTRCSTATGKAAILPLRGNRARR